MRKDLQFDAGNTRLKWRFIDDTKGGANVVRSGSIDNGSNWQHALAVLFDDVGDVQRVVVSSVSCGERLEYLLRTAQALPGVEVLIAKTEKSCAGVNVAYDQYEKLGVDRWLAMLSAHDAYPDSLKIIVDCGTAITVDVVDACGQHQGGYIVPGLRLMKTALAVSTADLDTVSNPAQAVGLGLCTPDCINNGVLAMVVSLIDRECLSYPDPLLIMTGGDAELIASHLKKDRYMAVMPDLVMDGLTVVGHQYQ